MEITRRIGRAAEFIFRALRQKITDLDQAIINGQSVEYRGWNKSRKLPNKDRQ